MSRGEYEPIADHRGAAFAAAAENQVRKVGVAHRQGKASLRVLALFRRGEGTGHSRAESEGAHAPRRRHAGANASRRPAVVGYYVSASPRSVCQPPAGGHI